MIVRITFECRVFPDHRRISENDIMIAALWQVSTYQSQGRYVYHGARSDLAWISHSDRFAIETSVAANVYG